MTEITYAYFEDNARMREEVEAAMERARAVFPSWLSTVRIELRGDDGDSDDCYARVRCYPEHRQMAILVYPQWFDQIEQKRARTLLHEVVHSLLASLTDWTRDVVLQPIKERNTELYNYLENEHRNRVEFVTQEITFVIDSLLSG